MLCFASGIAGHYTKCLTIFGYTGAVIYYSGAWWKSKWGRLIVINQDFSIVWYLGKIHAILPSYRFRFPLHSGDAFMVGFMGTVAAYNELWMVLSTQMVFFSEILELFQEQFFCWCLVSYVAEKATYLLCFPVCSGLCDRSVYLMIALPCWGSLQFKRTAVTKVSWGQVWRKWGASTPHMIYWDWV